MAGITHALLGLPRGLLLVLVFALPALEASAFVGIVFPGEIAILLGGVLAHEHRISLLLVIALGATGAIVGDSIGYEVGRHYGRRLLERLPRRLVKPDHLERGTALLRRRGGSAVFIGRFTAALRALIPGLAGMSGLPYRRFVVFNVAGGVAWSAETALVGYLAGASYAAAAHRLSLIGVGLLLVLVTGAVLVALRRRPGVHGWLVARWRPQPWTGRPLTLLTSVLIGAVWLLAGVGQDVVGHDGLATHDLGWHAAAVRLRTDWLTQVAKAVTLLGDPGVVWVLALVVLGVLARQRRWPALLVTAAAIGTGLPARHALNTWVARARPPRVDWLVWAGGHAWPSGHAFSSLLLAGVAVALLWPRLTRRTAQIGAITSAALYATAVGASRVYLGVHWVTDVLGGWLLAACWLAVTLLILHAIEPLPASVPEMSGSGSQ